VIGAGIAFIVVGLIFVFVFPWIGLAIGVVGVAFAVLWLVGVGRRVSHEEPGAPGRG
jgi:hypothetical protein